VARGQRGRLVAISAPSGAGKTTLVHELLRRVPKLRFSISFTTRPRRAAEIDGRDYFFVDDEGFRKMLARQAFLEYAQVFDHWYGTSREHTRSLIEQGYSVLLEIDWQGAAQIREREPEALSVFVLPPSRPELERRLRGRGTDSERTIQRRLNDALSDMAHWDEFDYVVINENVDQAAAELEEILQGRGSANRTDCPEMRARTAAILTPEQ